MTKLTNICRLPTKRWFLGVFNIKGMAKSQCFWQAPVVTIGPPGVQQTHGQLGWNLQNGNDLGWNWRKLAEKMGENLCQWSMSVGESVFSRKWSWSELLKSLSFQNLFTWGPCQAQGGHWNSALRSVQEVQRFSPVFRRFCRAQAEGGHLRVPPGLQTAHRQVAWWRYGLGFEISAKVQVVHSLRLCESCRFEAAYYTPVPLKKAEDLDAWDADSPAFNMGINLCAMPLVCQEKKSPAQLKVERMRKQGTLSQAVWEWVANLYLKYFPIPFCFSS